MHEGAVTLTEDQLNDLVDRLSLKVADAAAKRAIEIMYADVGKKAVRHLVSFIGFLAVCVMIFLAGKNAMHPP
jgi:hypothetical protein